MFLYKGNGPGVSWTASWTEKNPVHNVEQRETAIVLVKLYEYSVNMCQQRQHYFKNDVWKILAVYINIYYLYFVFEIAEI